MGIKWRDKTGEVWTAIVCVTERGMRFVELKASDGFVALSDMAGQDIEPDDCYREVDATCEDVAALSSWEGAVVA